MTQNYKGCENIKKVFVV